MKDAMRLLFNLITAEAHSLSVECISISCGPTSAPPPSNTEPVRSIEPPTVAPPKKHKKKDQEMSTYGVYRFSHKRAKVKPALQPLSHPTTHNDLPHPPPVDIFDL